MNKEQVIKEKTYPVLCHIGVAPEAASKLAPVLCEAVLKYGFRNQTAVVEAVKVVAPYFANISDMYFSEIKEIIGSSIKIDPEYYAFLDKMADAPDISAERKLQRIPEEIRNERNNKTSNAIKIILAIGSIFCILVLILVSVYLFSRVIKHREVISARNAEIERLRIEKDAEIAKTSIFWDTIKEAVKNPVSLE